MKRSSLGSGKGPAKKAKHKNEYDVHWKDQFPWHIPVYSEEGNSESSVVGLLCSICKHHGTKQRNHVGTWTDNPCTCLRKDLLQRHKASKMHKDAEILEADRITSQSDGGIVQAFATRVKINRKALVGALKIMYWLAKEEVAHTTKFSSLMDLTIQLGSDYLRELNLGRNAHYTSEQTVRELLHCLSSVIEEKILDDIRASDFFSLMTDESTDIAVLKQLVLVARYMTEAGVKTSFLLIEDIHDGKAETIEKTLLQSLKAKSLDITRLRAFGSDGAAVMTGRLNGVAVRLKRHSPKMISVHCVAHRLALAAAHAADGIPYLQRFKTKLQSLFYFYQNSAVRMSNLHAIQEVLEDPSIKCKQAKDVRWLSHDMAIKAVIRTLPSLFVSLDREASENAEPTAHGLLKLMKTYKFVACAYLLSDVLPHLSRLSKIFQKQSVDLSLVQPCVKTAIESIKQYETTAGPNLSKLDQVLATDLQDFHITPTEAQKQEFKSSVQLKYIETIVLQLQNRFPDVEYMDAFSIFDPQKLATSVSPGHELTVYGQERLEYLQSAYGCGVNPDVDSGECTQEWESLKRLFVNNFSNKTMRQMTSLLGTDSSLQDMYPNLSKLASIAALIPVSTAECERSFSTMNRVKTKLRNRMKTSTLDSLIRICMEGTPLTQFNFERAADIWASLRNRRLHIGVSSSSSTVQLV